MEQKWQVYHISRQNAGFNQSALQVSSFLASSPPKSGESQIDNSVKGDGTISLVRTLRQCITSVDARFNGFGHLRSTGLLHSTSHLTGEPGHETGAFNDFVRVGPRPARVTHAPWCVRAPYPQLRRGALASYTVGEFSLWADSARPF